tara:strand:- start:448 stop:915 length:468 start_codon:yes stop_codon:yes gene_type:complete
MKRIPSIRIYALAVCFVSIICVAITSGFALYNLITLIAPEVTIDPSRLQPYSSNEVFVRSPGGYLMRGGPVPAFIGNEGIAAARQQQDPYADKSEEEITALRLAQRQAEIDTHTSRARLSILRQGIIILISSILFFSHWRLAKSIDKKEEPHGVT